jgi:hypothetical protein
LLVVEQTSDKSVSPDIPKTATVVNEGMATSAWWAERNTKKEKEKEKEKGGGWGDL